MEPREQFGKNLRAQRERLGLSQEEVGERADLHRTEISLLERAARDPRLSTMVKIAHGLGVPPSDLLDGIK